MEYLIDEKSLAILNQLKDFDKDQFIDWEKTKERFIYINSKTKVELYDNIHGWYSVTTGHFRRGRRCPMRSKHHRRTGTIAKKEMMEADIHNWHDWTKTNFVWKNNRTKIDLYDKIYGHYTTCYNSYMSQGTRHPKRKKGGIDLSKGGYLYIIEYRIKNNKYQKVGITAKDNILGRYEGEGFYKKAKVLVFEYYSNVEKLLEIERDLKHSIPKQNRINKEEYIFAKGYTETCRNFNLLEIYNDKINFKYKTINYGKGKISNQ